MSDTWSVLLTGPTHGLEAWAAAGREAGWEVVSLPLVRTQATGTPLLDPSEAAPDWIVVTSASALQPLNEAVQARPELRSLPLLCVGEVTATRAQELGLSEARWASGARQDAAGLGRHLLEETQVGQRVLWPRGQRSGALADQLEAGGLEVIAPVVYESVLVELSEEPPLTDAVFFASPSGVLAWQAEERAGRPAAIAIGWTTYDALEPVSDHFSMVLPLIQPNTQCFVDCLRSFFPSE